MAIAYHSHACLVQAIHVTLRARGPARLPEHLWVRAKQELTEMPTPQQPNHVVGSGVCGSRGARAAAREHRACGSSCASVRLRVQLEMACCQSKKGAEFWMGRCGWDGSEDSRKALRRWVGDTDHFPARQDSIRCGMTSCPPRHHHLCPPQYTPRSEVRCIAVSYTVGVYDVYAVSRDGGGGTEGVRDV